MRKVRVCIELADDRYRSFVSEARRRGVSVESLLEKMVDGLLRELEQEEDDGVDHPIIPC
jgi:hypothetical protein